VAHVVLERWARYAGSFAVHSHELPILMCIH
jgi:hypothetical protein